MIRNTGSPPLRRYFGCFLALLCSAVFVHSATFATPEDVRIDITISPTISITVPSTANIGTPNAASQALSYHDLPILVSTNNPTGYVLSTNTKTPETCMRRVADSAVACNALDSLYKIPVLSSTTSSAAFPINNWGISIDNSASPTFTSYSPVPASTAASLTIRNHPANIADHLTTVRLGARVNTDITAGTYNVTEVFTAIANPRPTPTITSISPNSGLSGHTLTLTGASLNYLYQVFIGATSANVGGLECQNLTIVDPTTATCTIPTEMSFGDQAIRIASIYGDKSLIGPTFQFGDYEQELFAIETIAKDIFTNGSATFGTALTEQTAVTIRGINYWVDWYLVTAADLLAIDPTANTNHAPYIIRFNQYGHVMSIPGRIIDGEPIHTFNFFGDSEDNLVLRGLLTGVTNDSTTTACQWGELTIGTGTSTTGCGGGYDSNGGLILGTQHAMVTIDQTKPINQQYSIGFTVKGSYPQTNIETYPRTIVAISGSSSNYLSWIGIRNYYLQVYSFYSGSALSVDYDDTRVGYTSIDLRSYFSEAEINNEILNIQVTAERSGTTNVYINGRLIRSFTSGGASLAYNYITIGDLRPNRLLRYIGSIYNFALYAEVLTPTEVAQNFEFFTNDIGS